MAVILGISVSTAANKVFTGTFFDENGAYYGPDCENDSTQLNGSYYTGDYTSPFTTATIILTSTCTTPCAPQ